MKGIAIKGAKLRYKMEVVGLLFASTATVQLMEISQRVAKLENADKLVAYLSDFRIESSHKTLKIQLELGQSVCNDPFVDDGVKNVLDKTLVEIQRTLNTASEKVESALASSENKRHYFVYKRNRECLVGTIKRLKIFAKIVRIWLPTLDLVIIVVLAMYRQVPFHSSPRF